MTDMEAPGILPKKVDADGRRRRISKDADRSGRAPSAAPRQRRLFLMPPDGPHGLCVEAPRLRAIDKKAY